MKACIVSDSHDRAAALDAAVAIAKAEGAEVVIHCGDVIGANTLRPLVRHGLPVHVVHGNNLGDPGAFARIGAATGGLVHYHGADAELALAGRRVVATHYPHYGGRRRDTPCTWNHAGACLRLHRPAAQLGHWMPAGGRPSSKYAGGKSS